ncbi:MAG: protein-L-isoaspartate O-methyltransferase [Paracoccaceae bacterium]
MPDFAARRTMMVDNQVRPSDVTKLPIIESMLTIPRERFVPGTLVEAAYIGENLPIAPGRVLLEPRTLAKMLDVLDLRPNDLVLDIGCATGYSTAVIARMAEAVVALECDDSLAEDAESTLEQVGVANVAVEHGALAEGASAHGPYDAVILQGAIETLPAAIAAQIKDGGRIVAIFSLGALNVVRLGVKRGDMIHWRDIFNASAPVLPGFAAAHSFAL